MIRERYQSRYDAESRTWHGAAANPVFNPEAGVGQVVFELLNLAPERVAQIDMDTGRSMTYAEFKTRMVRFAQNLTDRGVQKGDVVALANAHSENLAPLVCALLSIGAPLNSLSAAFGVDDVANMLGATQPKVVFCDSGNYDTVRAAVLRVLPQGESTPIYVFEDARDDVLHAEDLLKETGREDEFLPQYLGDSRSTIAAIVCSSGSTGAHKGVSLSHATIVQMNIMMQVLPPRRSSTGRVSFAFNHIYWISGLQMMLNVLMAGDVRLFTRRAFDEELLFEAIERYRVAYVLMAPMYANKAVCHPRAREADLRSLEFWLVGGSMVPEDLRDRIDALLPNGRSVNGIGPSECNFIAIDFWARKRNAIGCLMPCLEARVVDDDGRKLGVGEQGELLIRPRYPFLGYYRNPTATADAVDGDGYFRTGDLGSIDEEGYVYVVGRKKDIFKYNNFHVTPSELEALVRQIEGVRDVTVVGIPDAARVTELPAALIVRSAGSSLDAKTVKSFVDSQVSDFKRLRGGVHFVDDLPKTANGKPLRRRVVEIVIEMNGTR